MFAKMLRKVLIDKDIKIKELAKRVGVSPQNISQRLAKDTFTEHDMRLYAECLGMDLVLELKDKDN